MKSLPVVVLLFLVTTVCQAQKHKPAGCCSMDAVNAFTALGSKADFMNVHQLPEKINFVPEDGGQISFATPDGNEGSAFAWNAVEKTDDYILVFHEWWGLNGHIMQEAEQLYNTYDKQINVIAVDLYDGKVAETREDAAKIMQSATDERVRSIINGLIEHIGDDADFATIGWCYGGLWSLQTSIMLNNDGEACVVFYGMPELDKEKLKELDAPVLGIFALQDKNITPEIVNEFEAAMKDLDKEVEIHQYDAVHAFANPSNPAFNSDAAEDAMGKATEFIRLHLLED